MTLNRRMLIALMFSALLVCVVVPRQADALTLKELVQLKKLGVSDAEMIQAIKDAKAKFTLTTKQKLYLLRNGVSLKVIQFIQGKSGTKTPAPTPTPTPTPKPKVVPKPVPKPTPVPKVDPEVERRNKLEAERRRKEQEERIKRELAKAKREAKLAYARGQLKGGMDLAREGKFVEAIQVFQKYLSQGRYKPGTVEYYNAKYGIANALIRAKLYQSAASTLLDVVLEGPKRPFFIPAFQQLMELRKKIEYYPPRLAKLATFCNQPGKEAFNASCSFVVGEYFFNQGQFKRALRHLNGGFMVNSSKDHPKRASVLYLLGIYQVELLKPQLLAKTKNISSIKRHYVAAMRSFQQAVVLSEGKKELSRVGHLAYVALARLSFALGAYDAAIFYYRKIPNSSTLVSTSFYEAAWTYFVKGDYSRALGMFHALSSPYFKHRFYPELHVLEAAAYMNMCHVDLAVLQMKLFQTRVMPQALKLRGFLRSLRGRSQLYKIIKEVSAGSTKYQLTQKLLSPVLSDMEFFNRHRTIRQIESELAKMKRNASRLGAFGENIVKRLNQLRAAQIREINNRIARIYSRFEASLADWAAKLAALQVDLNQLKIDELMRKTRNLVNKTKEKKKKKGATQGSTAIVGADQSSWPFEGEYWFDELGSIRSMLRERCGK